MRLYQIPLLLICLLLAVKAMSQKQDSAQRQYHFSGAISITNNGVSLVPTFSLGKPATIFNLSVGGERLSFEPDLRFSLEGKPWVFLFWWRYKLVKDHRLTFNVGTHPAINFRTVVSPTDGKTSIAVRRYLAGELAPSYALGKHFNLGLYYLYSRCLETDAARNNHFLALNGSISNIRLGNRFLLKAMPQLYLLLQDGNKGYFTAATVTLSARQFPLSLSSIVNKTIQSHIAGSKNWVWSLSLVYSFQRKLIRV